MFTSPIIPTMTTYAAEQQSNLPYSRFWETQADGSWKYKYDNGTYATGWIQDDVDGNWYYMDSAGIMKSGLYKSYDRYYLLSSLHDGHYGHLLTNGEVYQGVTISADTSETYRGALSQQTISQLGLDVSKAIDITGTQHVKGGKVVTPEQPQQTQENPTTQSNGGTSTYDPASGESYLDWLMKQNGGSSSGVGGTSGDKVQLRG